MGKLGNGVVSVGLLSASLCAGLGTARSDVPPVLCGKAPCDYLVRGFSGTYPNERDRINWQCYDRNSTISIACTFVRGDEIRKYSDVYRKKNEPTVQIAPNDVKRSVCTALQRRLTDLRDQVREAQTSFFNTDESDSGCEMISTVVDLLRSRRAVYEAFLNYKGAGCTQQDGSVDRLYVEQAKRRVARYQRDCSQAREALEQQRKAEAQEQSTLDPSVLELSFQSGFIPQFDGGSPAPSSPGPAGPRSTITGTSFGDKAPSGPSGPVRPAR